MKKIISLILVVIITFSGFTVFSDNVVGVDEKSDNIQPSVNSVDENSNDEKIVPVEKTLPTPENAMMIDKIKGGKKTYYTANIVLDGEKIESDVPAILYEIDGNYRTLVPIRVISEKLGADVKWEQDEMRVKIFYKGDVISLVINDSKAIVNGVEKPLPNEIPAKLMSYLDIQRTLVPIRFISETYGGTVSWDGDTRTVEIDSTKRVESQNYEKPAQSLVSLKVDNKDNPKNFELEFSDEFNGEWVTDFWPAENTNNLDRLIFDFKDVVLDRGNSIAEIYDENSKQAKLNLGAEKIKSVRIGQFQVSPYVTRVVIDMQGNHKYVVNKKGKIFSIELTGEVEETIKPQKIKDEAPSVVGTAPDKNFEEYFDYLPVKIHEFAVIKIYPDAYEKLALETKEDGSIDVKVSEKNFKLNQFNWQVGNEFLKSVSSTKRDGMFVINLVPTEGTKVYENPNTIEKECHELVFERGEELRQFPENKKLVVLDPGHGGSDVGAKSQVDGTTELSIIENMTPLVKQELEKLGYAVLLTRDSDIDLGLYPRTEYAELAKADVLVSIHANAFSAERAHGIETFKKTGRAESELLAQEILKFMVEFASMLDGNIINRGVKDGDLYITRMSHAPSTLLELGFITNTRELSNLKDPVYLKHMSVAIANGVHSYFSKTK